MTGKLLTVLDHLRDVGPIDALMAEAHYDIAPARFRSIISELRKVVQIESTAFKCQDRQHRRHELVKS